MDNSKDGKDIRVGTLRKFGITYEEIPISGVALKDLPKRVQVLREGLLSSNGRIIKEYIKTKSIPKSLQEKDKSIPQANDPYAKSIDFDPQKPSEIAKRLNAEVDLALTIWERAVYLENEISHEAGWEHTLLETVFLHLRFRESPTSGYWNDFTLGQPISLESNHLWNEDHGIAKLTNSGPDLTQPKPDIYLGFRMHDLRLEESRGFQRDDFMQNFSINTLGRLLNNDLVCTPTTGVRTYLQKRGKLRDAGQSHEIDEESTIEPGVENEGSFSKEHLLCFPWGIVELKRQNVGPTEIKKCYCQGANAASRALRMFEVLSRYSDTVDGEQIPPVIVLTFVGPLFKLWIAFSALDLDGKYHYKMVCIEEQSIVTLWGALRLCQIVNDMSFWATRILKPKISMYIDQWRSRHMHGFRASLSGDQVLFETVRKVEEREKQIGLHRSSNLAEIVRMTLMIQEISSVDAEIRSNIGSPSQGKQPDAPLNEFTTPVLHSGRKTATASTKGSKKTHNLAAATPSRSGATKNQISHTFEPAEWESIFTPGPSALQLSGTRDVATATSSTRSTTAYSATKLSSSSLSAKISTPPQKSSFGVVADFSITKSSIGFGETSKVGGASTALRDEVVTTSTAKSKGIFTEFLAEKLPATQLHGLGNGRLAADETIRLNKDSNISSEGRTMEDNTDILSSEWKSSKGQSGDDETLSEIIDDIRLFLWPEES